MHQLIVGARNSERDKGTNLLARSVFVLDGKID